MKYFIYIFYFSISCIFSTLSAQDELLIRYGEDQGLHSRVNYKISQNEKGYLLVGSDNGLYRFDGAVFDKVGKSTTAENKEILEAVTLNNGDIFFSAYYNSSVYVLRNNKKTDRSRPYFIEFKFKKSHQDGVNAVDRDNSSVYFSRRVGSENLFYQYRNGKVFSINIPFGKVENFDYKKGVAYITDERYSRLEKKIYAYNTKVNRVSLVKIDYEKYGGVIGMSNNKILLAKDQYIYIFDIKNGNAVLANTLFFDQNTENINFTLDDKSNLWIYNITKGTWYYNLNEKAENVILPKKMLETQPIVHVFSDKENNVWFSTKNDGIYFLSSLNYKNYVQRNQTPFLDYISVIKNSGNTLYLGLKNSGFAEYFSQNKYNKYYFGGEDIDEIIDLYVKDNKVFVADYNGPFYEFDIRTKKFTEGFLSRIKSIYKMSDREIVVSNGLGATVINIDTGKYKVASTLKSYMAIPFKKDSIFNGMFTNLYKVNINTKESKLFLKDSYLNQIVALGNGLFAGASNTRGVLIFNDKGIIQEINTTNGLKDNQITSLHVQNRNVLWASSTQGIYRIVLKPTLEIKNYSVSDGLFSNNVNGSITIGDSIYVGTNKGLSVFAIKSLLKNQKLNVRKPYVNYVNIDDEIFENRDKIVTDYNRNTVNINVSFVDYLSQGKVKFKYKLVGADRDWSYTSSNTIIYNSLSPGTYQFQVYGISSSNLVSPEMDTFELVVEPLFWQTWWFKGFVLLLFLGLVWFLFWTYKESKLRELKYQQKTSELELQAIKAQFNPHFIYNCLNSIQYLIYKKSFEDADRYLSTFSKMIRSTLHYSEHTFLSIEEEVKYLSIYLDMEKMRFKDNFDFNITVAPNVDRQMKIPTLLIQPYTENALKHGLSSLKDRVGKIDIHFKQDERYLQIDIRDNGVGFDKSKLNDKKVHLGLKISEKRIETYNLLFKTNIKMNLLSEKDQYTLIQIFIENDK